jgi:replicative DNA helicase
MSDFSPLETPSPESTTLPFSREAEEAVIGAVLINPEAYFDVAQFLRGEDFYIHRNRWVWDAFTQLQETRTPIDLLTVTEKLEQVNRLAEIGGPAYLTTLINQVPSSLHAEAYGRIIQEGAIRRRMLLSANEIANLAYDNEKPLQNIIDQAEQSVFSLSEERLHSDLQPIKNVLDDYFDHVGELSKLTDEIYGVPTGLIDIDKLLGGMQKSDLIIVAGRPGSGKTGFLLTVAKNTALIHKKHVAMFSLEMSNEQLVQRLIAQQTGIDSSTLRSGHLKDEQWPLFVHAIEVLSGTHIYLDDTPAITPLQLRTKCRRLSMEFPLDLVIVDYLQLMGGDTRTENRVQEVSYISRNLKVLARELKVPVLAAAQLSRAVEQRADKRPVLSDLRESGSLEQDSDIVMFIHRPDALEKDNPRQNIAEIIVGKHRNGPTHPGIELVFINELAKFENAATRMM